MSEAKRLRHPAEGGYARGEETRLRIIGAAIEVFGERGFEAASTRDIAARAGVNAPALQYYFANKEGVYRACAEHIACAVSTHFEPVLQRARATLASAGDDTPALIDAFIAIQEAIADRIFLSPATSSQRLFFVREQAGQEPPGASDILEQRMRGPLNRVGLALIARIGGTATDDPITAIRLMSLHGQMMPFHVAPRAALTLLGWPQFDADKRLLIRTTVQANARALLEMWSAERLEPAVITKGKSSAPSKATKRPRTRS
ncbi:CerR family C-terminal domain-containing protein [Trinickia sp. LjRoot230]|uniref:CerR family C-terminal domain-containing protein n=1 Tax=Trinickia sp. LjRoot230 TaxID=3342288 RepID=UPI003ED0B117